MTEFTCPRRSENLLASSRFQRDSDYDPSDDSCHYCGSLNPDTFIRRLEAGDVLLGSTDKNYKVYISNNGGAAFKQTYRDCPRDKEMLSSAGAKYMISSCTGPADCTHWVTREVNGTKFYFQHLSDIKGQRTRFIELLNEKKLKFEDGFEFYVLPFFIQSKGKAHR